MSCAQSKANIMGVRVPHQHIVLIKLAEAEGRRCGDEDAAPMMRHRRFGADDAAPPHADNTAPTMRHRRQGADDASPTMQRRQCGAANAALTITAFV